MTGRIITSDHRVYDLPALLAWNVTYTGGVPCDSFTVTCLYDRAMAEPLHLAAGFLAMREGEVMLRGIVDEYAVELTEAGASVTVSGRGYAARLLDNESRPVTYQGATLAEIVRCHVTPYGISAAEIAPVSASSVYTVASGTSQWKALEELLPDLRGVLSPLPAGRKAAGGTGDGQTGSGSSSSDDSPVLSCALREDHYGVLTEVLVIDKTRNVSYSVQNPDMIARGGQCRRVVYTPGQSTWAAMRYTGEYQIRRSREEERTAEVKLPGTFLAFPGDTVRLELETVGLTGEYRVAEAENEASSEKGETITLTLRERM